MTCSCEYAPVSPVYPPIQRIIWPYTSSADLPPLLPNSWTSRWIGSARLESSVLMKEPSHVESKSLTVKLLGDIGISAIVALGAAPWISVIDKAVVERSAGRRTILQSCTETLRTMARDPMAYLRSPMFLIMWGCYASTYATGRSFFFFSLFYVNAQRLPLA